MIFGQTRREQVIEFSVRPFSVSFFLFLILFWLSLRGLTISWEFRAAADLGRGTASHGAITLGIDPELESSILEFLIESLRLPQVRMVRVAELLIDLRCQVHWLYPFPMAVHSDDSLDIDCPLSPVHIFSMIYYQSTRHISLLCRPLGPLGGAGPSARHPRQNLLVQPKQLDLHFQGSQYTHAMDQ